MGIMDALFGGFAPNPERQAQLNRESAASAAALETEAEFRKQQAADAKRKAELERAQEAWVKKNYPGADYATMPTGLVPMLATYQMSTGQLAPPEEWKNIYTMAVYGQKPGEQAKTESEAKLAGNKASLIGMVMKGLDTTSSDPNESASPSQGAVRGAGMDVRTAIPQRVTGYGGIPNLASMPRKVDPVEAMATTGTGRLALDAAGFDADKVVPKRVQGQTVINGRKGQAMFDQTTGKMIPGSDRPVEPIPTELKIHIDPNTGEKSARQVALSGPSAGNIVVQSSSGELVDTGIKYHPGYSTRIQRKVVNGNTVEEEVYAEGPNRGKPVGQSYTVEVGSENKPVGVNAADYKIPGKEVTPDMTPKMIAEAGGGKAQKVEGDPARLVAVQAGIRDLNELELELQERDTAGSLVFNADGSPKYDRSTLWQGFSLDKYAIPGKPSVLKGKYKNVINPLLRIETGANAPPAEVEDMFVRYPVSPFLSDSEIAGSFRRLRTTLEGGVTLLDPKDASDFQKSIGLRVTGTGEKGTVEGKQYIAVFNAEMQQAASIPPPDTEFQRIKPGQGVRDPKTGAVWTLDASGQKVRVR